MATGKWTTPPASSLQPAELAAAATRAVAALDAASDDGRRTPATRRSGAGQRRRAVQPAGGSAGLPVPARQDWRADRDRRDRVRAGQQARRMPYKATAATAVTGLAAWGAAELADVLVGTGGRVLVTGATSALALSVVSGVAIARRQAIGQRWRRRYWITGTGATVWVTLVAILGVGWVLLAVLVAAATAVSARWQREHQVPLPPAADDAPLPAPVEVVDDLGAEFAARWERNVARDNRPVPGSLLTDREDLDNGYRWTLQTPAGTTSYGELLGKREKIASGLRVAAAAVQIDPHPSRDESMAQLTVLTRDVLRAGVPWPGPRYHDGRIPIGPYADGSGDAEWIAYSSQGAWGGLITGETGSGKSSCFESIGLSLLASGEWIVLYLDGDMAGGSSPVMNDYTTWAAAGPDGALRQLEAIEAVLEVRGLLKPTFTAGPDGKPIPRTDPAAQRPVRELLPCPSVPGVAWMIDELARLTKDARLQQHQFNIRLEDITRRGRKYGVAVVTASQSLLVGDYGNSTSLRAQLAVRNILAFRNQNKNEKELINGLLVPPYTLPTGGGYAYSAGGGRVAMLRAAWTDGMAAHAPAASLVATADPDTELALAQHRPTVSQDPAELLDQARRQLATWRSTHRTTSRKVIVQAERLPLTSTGAGPDHRFTEIIRAIPKALDASNVIPLQRRPAAPADDTGLTDNQRAVLDALRQGTSRVRAITEHTGIDTTRVSKVLAALSDRGLAIRREHGVWAAAHTPTANQTAGA